MIGRDVPPPARSTARRGRQRAPPQLKRDHRTALDRHRQRRQRIDRQRRHSVDRGGVKRHIETDVVLNIRRDVPWIGDKIGTGVDVAPNVVAPKVVGHPPEGVIGHAFPPNGAGRDFGPTLPHRTIMNCDSVTDSAGR
ncbi:hypothetical protein FAIPA1_290010 [Frankia sp. AiPs1]